MRSVSCIAQMASIGLRRLMRRAESALSIEVMVFEVVTCRLNGGRERRQT